jgi:lipid-binding SYLF domain-containing protein
MPGGIHNPLPSSVACKLQPSGIVSITTTTDELGVAECKKCAKILQSFIDPRQVLGPDKVIPPTVLAQAKV